MGAFPSKEDKANMRSAAWKPYVLAGVLLLVAGGLMLLFSHGGEGFFPAYREFSKTLMGALAALASIAPFSLWDILALLLIVVLAASFIVCVARRHSLMRWLGWVLSVVAALLLFLVGAWGLNHYAPPLAHDLGLEVKEYSADELADATRYYLEAAAAQAQELPRDANMVLEHQDFYELAREAGAAYVPLANTYPVFSGSTAPVKALLVAGEPLLYSGHSGIFWPFTGEANVPLNCADADLPFTLCHEAAHRLGIASEQEANFAAYLACAASDDARFSYSGNYRAFCYCFNALAANYPARAEQLMKDAIGEEPDPPDAKTYGARLVFYDRQNTAAHYAAYEGPASEVGTAANDAYLKAFDEESGVKSYGEVVDYLIAWYVAL